MSDPRTRLAALLAPLEVLDLRECSVGRRIEFSVRVDTGPITPTAPARAWSAAVRAVEAESSPAGEGPVDGVLMRRWRESLPATYSFLSALWSILDLVERDDGRHRLHLNSSRDPDGLAAAFPSIDRLVGRLGRLLSVEARVAPAGGLPADRLVLRTEDAWLEWSADLDPDRSIDPRDWRIDASAEIRAGALVVPIEGLRIDVFGRPGPDSLAIHAVLPGPLAIGDVDVDRRTERGRHVLAVSARVEIGGPPLVVEAVLAASRLFSTGAGEASSDLERYGRTLLDRLLADLRRVP